jgi:hypothetical protein
LTRGNHQVGTIKKGLAPAQGQRDHHVVTGCRLLILIAAPFSSRLSRYI